MIFPCVSSKVNGDHAHDMCMDVCTHVITSIGYTVASLIKNFLTTKALLIVAA